MREFTTAKMDDFTFWITIFFGIICIAAGAVVFSQIQQNYQWIGWATVILLLGSLVVSYLLQPQLFISNNGDIVIKTFFKTITINQENIQSVFKRTTRGADIRTFGVGGVFGYFGYYNFREIWFVTNRLKKIQIKTSTRTYVISPENGDEFISAFSSYQA